MKVKQAMAYALHALMYMVRHITQLPVTAGSIAKAEGIPAGYLAKIFRQLVKANIVKAYKHCSTPSLQGNRNFSADLLFIAGDRNTAV